MKKKNRTRKVIIVLVCILIPLGAFGFGYFWGSDNENHEVAHTLSVNGNIQGSITEDVSTNVVGMVPGDQVETTINIKPMSTADSLLRVKVDPYWKTEDGRKNISLSNKNLKLIEKNLETNITDGKWYKEGGYYYYMGIVKNENSIELIKGIEFLVLDNEDSDYNVNDYQNKSIGIEVTMEMVQCSDKAYTGKWNSNNDLPENLKTALDKYSTESKKLSVTN